MAAKKATKKVTKKEDKVYYVVMERKFFSSAPISLFRTRAEASNHAMMMDANSGLSFNKYTVARVELEA